MRFSLYMGLVFMTTIGACGEPLLETPGAPFLRGAENASDATVVESRFKPDGIVHGTKQLLWTDEYDSLRFLNHEQMIFGLRLRVKPSIPDWDPFSRFEIKVDEANRSVERTREFRMTEDAIGVFKQTVSLRNDGWAEIVNRYEAGENLPAMKEQLTTLFFPLHMIQGMKLRITENVNNDKDVELPGKADWGDGNENFWIHGGWFPRVTRIVFAPDRPNDSFTLEFPDETVHQLVIFRVQDGAHFSLRPLAVGSPFIMRLDFGRSGTTALRDHVVNDINFTRNNAFEVPVFDEKRNLFINSSFEAGARYFHDHNGGGDVERMIDSGEARSGRQSLRLAGGLKSFPFPTRANRDYTISFYAKSADGNPAKVRVEADHYFLTGEKPAKTFEMSGNSWSRHEMTFRWPHRATALSFSGQDVCLDDLQFEEGSVASPYYGNAFGLALLSDSTDPYFIAAEHEANARLLIRGPAGARGKIETQIEDFFRRETFSATIDFALSDIGEAVLPLAPDTAFPRGVNRIRLRVEPEGYPSYTDYLRLARFPYADNSAKHRNIHAISRIGWPREQLGIPDSVFRMMKYCGVGSFTYAGLAGTYDGPLSPPFSRAVAERYRDYGFSAWTPLVYGLATEPRRDGGTVFGIDGEPLLWEGRNLTALSEYPPVLLEKIESLSARASAKYPWVKNWIIWTEPSGVFATLKEGNVAEYTRLVLAMHRGLLRGNPEILFSPYGACTLAEAGRREILAFLSAAKQLAPDVRFATIDAHPYRAFPELPDFEGDLTTFLDDLERIGYGDISLNFLEGAYFYPLIVNPWQGIAPWHATQAKDGYLSIHLPSYDLGWGERVAAAMLMRYWLVAYKYADRVKTACTWGSYFLDASNPLAAFVMSAALTDLLGNSTFREDVRFAPGARAYLFNDGENRTIAAVWRFEEEMDRGLRGAYEMSLPLNGLAAEFIDMMGNVREARKVEGGVLLPLSNFPVFIRVAERHAGRLSTAIASATVRNDARSPLEFTVRPVTPARIVLQVTNPLSQRYECEIAVGDDPMQKIALAPRDTQSFDIALKTPLSFAHINDFLLPVATRRAGETQQIAFQLYILPVKRVVDYFAWEDLPAVSFEHVHMEFDAQQRGLRWEGPQDLSALGRFGWNGKGLWLRLEVVDDQFVLNHENPDPMSWYDNDGVQLFFDTLGDAPEKARARSFGFDDNDYSYELLPTGPDAATVFRRHAPDHQFTGGVEGGLKGNVPEPAIKIDFRRENGRMTYTTFFPKRYLMPTTFEAGRVAGLGVKIYDRDEMTGTAKQNIGNIPVEKGDAFQRPDLYTQLLLVD